MRGLYAITSEALCRSRKQLIEGVDAALRGGAAVIQYRDKWNAPEQREAHARELLALCRAHSKPLIINDDAALAARIGADGVHVGQLDVPLAQARALLGPKACIGVSCGPDLPRALAAAAQGASYVAFGRFYESGTKPQAPQAQAEILSLARSALPAGTVICAIGGLTPENAPPLIGRGADLIAAVEGVFGASDIRQAASRYAALFTG